MSDRKVTFALALQGKTLEMLEELQKTLKCCNHAQTLERAVRIAYLATRTEKDMPEKKEGPWFKEFVKKL